MNNHVMFDFETLGTTPDCVVISLGAVRFDNTGILEKREWHFNINQQFKAKRAVSGDTIVWWMKQDAAAKAVFEKAQKTGMPVGQFAQELSAWLAPLDVRVWGNGATFDISILENIFNTFQTPVPWKYWSVRCYRTIKLMFDIEAAHPFTGTKHCAIDDATYQAERIIEFFAKFPNSGR